MKRRSCDAALGHWSVGSTSKTVTESSKGGDGFGHCGRSGVAVRETASRCFSVVGTVAIANVRFRDQRMRTRDPKPPCGHRPSNGWLNPQGQTVIGVRWSRRGTISRAPADLHRRGRTICSSIFDRRDRSLKEVSIQPRFPAGTPIQQTKMLASEPITSHSVCPPCRTAGTS